MSQKSLLSIGLAAVAVGLFVLITWRATAAGRALPDFTLETPGLSEPVTVVVGGTITVRLRPAAAVSRSVAAAGYWERDGDVVKPWKATSTVAKDGTVDLVGVVDAPFGGVEAILAFVVTGADETSRAPAKCAPPSCRVLRQTVRLVRPIVPATP